MIDERLPLDGPVFAHDCSDCVFLGHYQEHDLYFCPKDSVDGGTVIARWSGIGSDYASGLVFGRVPLGEKREGHGGMTRLLRVAYLIAADLGYVPFVWQGMEVWPYNCRKEQDDGAEETSNVPGKGM